MTQVAALTDDERLLRPQATPHDREGLPHVEIAAAKNLNVDEQLAFVEILLQKYISANDPAWQPFQSVKLRILQRQGEKRLFLGVIGEFSSGKSTLVNALIRHTLLRTDVLQGTTAAATLLRFGENLDVTIRRKKKWLVVRAYNAVVNSAKKIKSLFSGPPPKPTEQDLLQLIHQATSDEEFAKDIVQVDVSLPSQRLLQGLVVVDTPGVNAENPRHALVTSAALRDLCDAALVVVPAEHAGSESLFQFLQTHAHEVLHRCMFLVTKIDLIRREKERERVLHNLRARIQQQLGIVNPRVLACAPQFVVESLTPPKEADTAEFTPEEIQGWLQHFVAMEADLVPQLRLKRMQSQLDDLAKLAMQLLEHLQQLLQGRLTGYRERHEALQSIVIPDIDHFIGQRIDRHVKRCEAAIQKIDMSVGHRFQSAAQSIMAEMSSAISSADSKAALRTAVESKVPSLYSSGQKKLQNILQGIIGEISVSASSELRNFHDEFQQHFQKLATLGGTLNIGNVDARSVARDFSSRGEAANLAVASELRGITQQQTFAKFGSAAGGAVIGSFIVPGIGTVMGGIVGGLVGMMFGPALDELKAKCWNSLEGEVEYGLNKFAESANAAITETSSATLQELSHSIASYMQRYKGLVEKMRQRDAEEKQQLAVFQQHIQADLQLIHARRQHLDGLRAQLRDL